MNDDEFEQALTDTAAGRGPDSAHRDALSHLSPEQLPRFRAVWEALDERQKLALLQSLADAEYDTLRVDFNEIYHLGMVDESAEVRRTSVESTVEDDSRWLLDRLLSLVARDQEADVRAAAAAALGPFALRAELEELPRADARRVRDALIETIHRPGERIDVQAAALGSVGYFTDELVRRELEAGYRDEALRLEALRGMGRSANPVWLETLLREFDNPDDALRLAAAEAAGEIGDAAAVEGLIELIDDPALPVRLAAIAALGEIGGEEAREALVYALEDELEEVREAAEAALEEIDFFEDPLGS
jgi:HEAT repeat protein